MSNKSDREDKCKSKNKEKYYKYRKDDNKKDIINKEKYKYRYEEHISKKDYTKKKEKLYTNDSEKENKKKKKMLKDYSKEEIDMQESDISNNSNKNIIMNKRKRKSSSISKDNHLKNEERVRKKWKDKRSCGVKKKKKENSSYSNQSSSENMSDKKKKGKEEKKMNIKNKSDNTNEEIKKKKEFDEHIYDSKEMIRLTINILQNYNFLNNLKILYKKLDNKKKISLENIKDLKLKKKLRHLLRSWKLEKKDEYYKKPLNFRENIYDIFNNLLYYFLSKIDLNKLRENISKRRELLLNKNYNKSNNSSTQRKLSNISDYYLENVNDSVYDDENLLNDLRKNNSSDLLENSNHIPMKSLRELHEEGFFKNSKENYKEFVEKHKEVDLWGKNEQEQKYLLSSKNKPNERKRFDRETDLCINKFVNKQDYKKLIKNTKDHVDDKFHKTENMI
ncbi:hypothetical protein PFFVO_01723 [Plasmodium falciparum Vietnam Oak-Knoll (FVO)]|uniref:Uncharacterized protein n=1 Tax=Plasmodium falciparum Vietnam Oak-Knoll (FVO) TaxID=1036723 RepID=A0A024V9W6_PLAFA|nr:hypothetical protein PFFVO_01723 [Plasmodium falciparum Vietnam Oak-Knoll (FVO)]